MPGSVSDGYDGPVTSGFRCQHEGCNSTDALACYLGAGPTRSDEPVGYYCPEHAFALGHCALCGEFWAGVESFDTGDGLCEICDSDADDDDDFYDWGEDEDDWISEE